MISLFKGTGPFTHENVRWYAWFTTAFHARFYYPVLAILFLDLGLSLSQFVTLNAIWAGTILLAEVPSGALADLLGRRRLLILAASLMVLEMLVLLCAPRDAGVWLFGFCAVNRVLSGLAEAAASGADEALAYDSLDDREGWDEVLEVTMRLRAGAMVLAMVTGALVYDAGALGLDQDVAQRLPVLLCLGQAVAAFLISLRFCELEGGRARVGFSMVLKQTWGAARWVFTTRAALLVVLGGLLIDGVMRNFATISSEYYRLIGVPTFSFGFIAAGTALLGMWTPILSRILVRRFSPLVNFTMTAIWMFFALFFLGKAWVSWGVIPGVGIMVALSHLGFLVSCYLNDLASSDQRATVLSVKGLLFNIGYGVVSLCFAGAVAWRREESVGGDHEALVLVLGWQPWIFAGGFLVFLVVSVVWGLPRRMGRSGAE